MNTPSGFESLIFDLDGTLWDSSGTCAQAWNGVLREKGTKRRVNSPALRSVMGRNHREIADLLLFEFEASRREALLDACYQREIEYLREQGGDLYPHVQEVLDDLAKRVPLAIVSNCQDKYIEAFLSCYQWEGYFVDFESSGRTGKTKSENLRDVLERNSFKKPAFVGDTPFDQEAAKSNDIPFIHASYGFGVVDQPDAVIENLRALKTMIL